MTATTELTFEQAFAALEQEVHRLEDGELSLAEALAAFERGMQLAEMCDKQLQEAELRVRQIVPGPMGGLQAVDVRA